jgi:hypothetical protein
MKPTRIQRRRTKGWRMPENTVSVTRPGRWGNPYFPGCGIGYGSFNDNGTLRIRDADTPEIQVLWFRWKMEETRKHFPAEFEKYIAPLRGKNLACFCAPDQTCHADVLLKLANDD